MAQGDMQDPRYWSESTDGENGPPVQWSWTYGVTGEGPYCEGCGERFYPDCDVSSVSTAEEFERHMADRHGLYPQWTDGVT